MAADRAAPAGSTLAVGGDCVLGVARSLTGKRWRARQADARLGLTLAQRLGVPEIVGRVLAARNVPSEAAEAYLNPTIRVLLPDPSELKDMDRAAQRVVRAVAAGERIAVFGDYDVDGAAAAALLHRFLSALGAPPVVYVPDRLREGYGPNAAAFGKLRADGVSLTITVDCGTAAHEALESAAESGMDVIVVDHHVAEPRLPRAFAVVNPNRLDESGAHRQLAAVGVAFLLAVAVNRALRTEGIGERGEALASAKPSAEPGPVGPARAPPDLLELLDLVALGTVCDVVPLTGANRAFVAQGLKVLARRANAGLAALADVAGLSERPTAYHLGFVLGPRVNAGGRVGESSLGARLLASDDGASALAIARRLDVLNSERQAIEAAVLDSVLAQIEREPGRVGALVFAAGEGWHPGVIGIVASRLVERYGRPACVVALDSALGRGSARSVPGVAIGPAVIAARQAGLLSNGGGHAMAAGFTVVSDEVDRLRDFLEGRVAAERAAGDSTPYLWLDGALTLEAANAALAAELARLAPFGAGNAEPVFALPEARVARADVVGERHVRCFLAGLAGGRLKAIAFRSAGTELGRALLGRGGAPLHLAGHLRADRWQGRDDVQFVIEDGAPAWARAGETG
ncbi:MAG: single-stranded-DNA-specific exonuclease RecJ [Alphaproteobacteria bacterium]